MSNICKKCGCELEDDARFCPECGTAVSPEASQPAEETQNVTNDTPQEQQTENTTTAAANQQIINTEALKQKVNETADKVKDATNKVMDSIPNDIKNDNQKIGMIAAIAIGVIILLLLVIAVKGCAGGGYKNITKKYYQAVVSENGEAVRKLMVPDVVEYMEDEWDYDFDDMTENMTESFEDDLGNKIKVKSYKVEKAKKLDKDDLEDIEDDLDDTYDSSSSVKAGYKVKGTFTLKGKDDDADYKYTTVVIKTEGHWYIYTISLEED